MLNMNVNDPKDKFDYYSFYSLLSIGEIEKRTKKMLHEAYPEIEEAFIKAIDSKDYKKVREYNYIENYTKELEWCEKEYVCGRKMYLSEINGSKYRLEIVLYNDFFKYYVDFNNKNIIQKSIEGDYLDYLNNIKEEVKNHHINYVKQFFI
jgi:hypothetical protein